MFLIDVVSNSNHSCNILAFKECLLRVHMLPQESWHGYVTARATYAGMFDQWTEPVFQVHRRRARTVTVSTRRLQVSWLMWSVLQREIHPWGYVVNPLDGAEQQPCRKHGGRASCGSAHPSYHMIAEQMNAERRLGMTNGWMDSMLLHVNCQRTG